VAAVVAYHADVSWLPAGFLGVDVFFVISGYLVCSLLVAEWDAVGSLSIAAFWRRRAKRILPAMVVVVSAAGLAFAHDAAGRLRGDAIAGLLGAANLWQILSRQSYFEAWGRPPLLRHLWSLGIEAQFYLALPLLLAALLPRVRRRGLLAGGAVLGGLLSAGLMAMMFDPARDPSRVYYGTDTRMIGLWFGVALALAVPPGRMSAKVSTGARHVLDFMGAAALVAIGALMAGLDEYSPGLYRGGFVLVAIASAIAVGVAAHPASGTGRLLSRQPFAWIGTRSYAIYLWHWPIFMLTRPGLDIDVHGNAALVVRLALTALLAEASWRLVERPPSARRLSEAVTRWRALPAAAGARHALGVAVASTLLLAGLSAVATHPTPDGGERRTAPGDRSSPDGAEGGATRPAARPAGGSAADPGWIRAGDRRVRDDGCRARPAGPKRRSRARRRRGWPTKRRGTRPPRVLSRAWRSRGPERRRPPSGNQRPPA